MSKTYELRAEKCSSIFNRTHLILYREDYVLRKNFETNFTFYSLFDNCTKLFEEINGTVVYPNRPRLLSDSELDLNALMNFASNKSVRIYTKANILYIIKFKNLLGIYLNLLKNLNTSSPFENLIKLWFSEFRLYLFLNDNLLDYCDRNLTQLVDRPIFS